MSVSFEQEQFPTIIARELSTLVLGPLLGEGAFRRVYEWLPDPKLVAKVEFEPGGFANVMEWEFWKRARGTPLERWLAPCEDISGCGTILLQQRTDSNGQEPKLVPAIFKDRKWTNWGKFRGRLVCHDYGLVEFQEAAVGALKMEPWNPPQTRR